MQYLITQYYLPPGRGDIFPPLPQPQLILDLATPGGMQGWVTKSVISSMHVQKDIPKQLKIDSEKEYKG